MLDENFNKIIELIEQRKNNAYVKINEELILMYLDVGKFCMIYNKIVNMAIKQLQKQLNL